MDVFQVLYDIRDELLKERKRQSENERDACSLIAAIVSFKVCGCYENNGFIQDGPSIVQELRASRPIAELMDRYFITSDLVSNVTDSVIAKHCNQYNYLYSK